MSLINYVKNRITGVQKADQTTQLKRLTFCFGGYSPIGYIQQCEFLARRNNSLSQCNYCGCFVERKVEDLDEKCPIGKW